MVRRVLIALGLLVIVAVAGVWIVGRGWLGVPTDAGEPNPVPADAGQIAARDAAQQAGARRAGIAAPEQILFGDLHVHSTFSFDAFMMSLPTAGGDGARPVSDACDFARHCAALDFWSINDHALALTPTRWQQTAEAIRACNAVAGDENNPDVVAFLGWEWTQVGSTPANHYGHKNVILRHTDPDRIPTRPIAAVPPGGTSQLQRPPTMTLGVVGLARASQANWDLIRYFQETAAPPICGKGPVRDLEVDCREQAKTPAELFAKLRDWNLETLVIPHGTSWGFYTPAGSSWDKQLNAAMHDPTYQRLIEVYSGHGNSEEYRSWREVELAADGTATCPEAAPGYTPSCWRAGEIIRKRCVDEGAGADECDERARVARQIYVDTGQAGHLTVPAVEVDEWLDAGQCTDCFLPAFNYRPRNSVQYIEALTNFDDANGPRNFRFGFMASSDNHSARPGTGYKETARRSMTEGRFAVLANAGLAGRFEGEPYQARSLPLAESPTFFVANETERGASFFLTGGLIATHAEGRSRDAIWDAMQRREVYGTSGPRILLWFDLVNPPEGGRKPMGSEVAMSEAPAFEVRALGSFEQNPGCPEPSAEALGAGDLERLCRGECYHPSDQRRIIERIEIVRILPKLAPDESMDALIQDPWKVVPCFPDDGGCQARFSDPDFPVASRNALYYARAIEAPSPAVAADPLRCTRDADGKCVSVSPCAMDDDACLAPASERAWSSPIFVDYAGGGP